MAIPEKNRRPLFVGLADNSRSGFSDRHKVAILVNEVKFDSGRVFFMAGKSRVLSSAAAGDYPSLRSDD